MNEGGAELVPKEGQVRVGTASFRRVNLALFCAGFITFVTLYDVQPLLPLFAREFSVSPAIASLPLSVATIALAVGMLIAGVPSVAMASLGKELDAQSIGHAMGLYISGNAMGGMTGRIGSDFLCDYMSWPTAIFLVGIISLLLTLVFLRVSPPRPILCGDLCRFLLMGNSSGATA